VVYPDGDVHIAAQVLDVVARTGKVHRVIHPLAAAVVRRHFSHQQVGKVIVITGRISKTVPYKRGGVIRNVNAYFSWTAIIE